MQEDFDFSLFSLKARCGLFPYQHKFKLSPTLLQGSFRHRQTIRRKQQSARLANSRLCDEQHGIMQLLQSTRSQENADTCHAGLRLADVRCDRRHAIGNGQLCAENDCDTGDLQVSLGCLTLPRLLMVTDAAECLGKRASDLCETVQLVPLADQSGNRRP